MYIPLFYFLYIYFVFLAIWAIFSLIGIFHLLKFGLRDLKTFWLIAFYVGGSALLLTFYFNFFNQFDWQSQINFNWISFSPQFNQTVEF